MNRALIVQVFKNRSYEIQPAIQKLIDKLLSLESEPLFLWDLTQFGNTKLPKTTAIVNFGPAKYCPSKTLGLCPFGRSGKCYAERPENFRPQVLPYRLKQAKFWLSTSGEDFARQFIEMYGRKRNKPTLLRLNESGDMFSQFCVDKVYTLARIIFEATGVKTYLYTHRTDLTYYGNTPFLSLIKSESIHVNGIGTEYRTVDRVTFEAKKADKKAFPNYKSNANNFFCPGSCKACKLCAFPPVPGAVIYNKIH